VSGYGGWSRWLRDVRPWLRAVSELVRGRGGWLRWFGDVCAWLRAVDVDVGGEMAVEVGSGGDREVEMGDRGAHLCGLRRAVLTTSWLREVPGTQRKATWAVVLVSDMLTSVKREASGPTSPNFGLTRERKALHAQPQLNTSRATEASELPTTIECRHTPTIKYNVCTHNHNLERHTRASTNKLTRGTRTAGGSPRRSNSADPL
jgi:hypothetical protein